MEPRLSNFIKYLPLLFKPEAKTSRLNIFAVSRRFSL